MGFHDLVYDNYARTTGNDRYSKKPLTGLQNLAWMIYIPYQFSDIRSFECIYCSQIVFYIVGPQKEKAFLPVAVL